MSEDKEKTIRVLMVCAMGMSSSLLEDRTRKAAEASGVSFFLKAISTAEVSRWDPTAEPYDIVLVAPQSRFKKRAIAQMAEPHGIIVRDIDTITYGMVDGEKLLKQVMAMIEERDKGA
jgi:PTS system cellobiose-specific IIB component